MTLRSLAGFASVLSAAASSTCCWLPLALIGLGLSAGFASFFEGYRSLFLLAAVLLLGAGYYLNYFRKERCAAGTACSTTRVRLRRLNRVLLWISTVLVAAFALFPQYVGSLVEASTEAGTRRPQVNTWTLQIEGMTCAGCEAAVTRSLADVPGVLEIRTSHRDALAVASVDAENPPSRLALRGAVAKAGYRLVSIATTPSDAESAHLEGHWTTELEEGPGEATPFAMDLGVMYGRWVGEFDLAEHGVVDYPMEVRADGDSVRLFFSALAMSFAGSIDATGALAGTARSHDQGPEIILFRRTGPARFSEGILRLEAAADDASLVQILSEDGSELRERFDADRDKTRLLLLLSPT